MEPFTKAHADLLLDKEWLVKVDTERSVPYLLKFGLLEPDSGSCCLLVTDTKSVWTEVLTSKQFARRWRMCNPTNAGENALHGTEAEENAWRAQRLEVLSRAHTPGGIVDIEFDVVDSIYSDLALSLSLESSPPFCFRWETSRIGAPLSASILSKHLILPLISITHLAYTSPEAVGEMSERDLERSVDKIGRSARRSVDTHLRHALSNPRTSTTLGRMSALFNFVTDLPPVVFETETPDLSLPQEPRATNVSEFRTVVSQPPRKSPSPQLAPQPKPAPAAKSPSPSPMETDSPALRPQPQTQTQELQKKEAMAVDSGTDTESSSDEGQLILNHKLAPSSASQSRPPSTTNFSQAGPSRAASSSAQNPEDAGSSSSESPKAPPKKRVKASAPRTGSSSDTETDEDAPPPRPTTPPRPPPPARRGGARQPVVRGKKKF